MNSAIQARIQKIFTGGVQPWRITVEVLKYEKWLIFSFPVISAILSFENSRGGGVRTPQTPPLDPRMYMYNWFVQNPFMFPVNHTLPRNNNSDKKPRMYMVQEPHAVSLPIPTAWWGLNGITHYLDL